MRYFTCQFSAIIHFSRHNYFVQMELDRRILALDMRCHIFGQPVLKDLQ